ncbi:MAG: thioredoxin domain-containing protein, partial [Candidatus Binatia bacterium]
DNGEIFGRIYDVSEHGNFEEKNILHSILTVEQATKYFRKNPSEIAKIISDAKHKLFVEREKRIKPFRDEKIITAWNGLMISGLAAAIKISPRSEYIDATDRTIKFIFAKMFRDGFLLHTYKDGQAKLLGYLDDYAFLAVGLLDVYEALFDRSLLDRARQLTEIMLREFSDEDDGAFFFTGKSHEPLISRAKPIFDASIPSGNAMATQLLLRLHYITGNEDYRQRAEKVLRSYYDAMESQPFGFAHLLCALDFYLAKPKEIVVIGEQQDAGTREFLEGIYSSYLPNMTLQLAGPDEPLEKISPLLEGKTQLNGKPTVYLCQNVTCSAPVTSWSELKPLLES